MESYEELKEQRDYYKHVAEKNSNLIDCAKITIYTVIGILFCCLEF